METVIVIVVFLAFACGVGYLVWSRKKARAARDAALEAQRADEATQRAERQKARQQDKTPPPPETPTISTTGV